MLAMVTIGKRARNFGSRPEISARSVLVTIFGDSIVPTGGAIWLGDLIELAAPFGFNDRLVRTSMYRLTAEGWFLTERVGRRSRYTLTEFARREFIDAEERIYGGDRPVWDGEWTLVLLGDRTPESDERDKLAIELSTRGFARLGGGVLAFPGDGRPVIARSTVPSGVAVSVPTASARFDDELFGSDRALAAAFGLEAAAHRYREVIDRHAWTLAASPVSDLDAFAIRTMVVHDLRRATLLDPWLPERLLPSDWPGDEARALAAGAYLAVTEGAWRRVEQVAGLPDPSSGSLAARRFEREGALAV
jgi:phenylacetic acid degradation operon negative regulatory protein